MLANGSNNIFYYSGLINMINAFGGDEIVLGIFCLIAFVLWAGSGLYNFVIFVQARKTYSALGGNQAATREFGKAGAQMAYENRETIKKVAVENKDTIKQIAADNKDLIIEVAKENRHEIARAAMENKDTIWENRDIVSSVFDEPHSAPQDSNNPFV
jgi:hypothetical protein